VFFQGDCDDGCLNLAKLLGWEEDLDDLILKNNRRLDDERKNK
jgi:hypothetical protein